jgi:hypothetical protein
VAAAVVSVKRLGLLQLSELLFLQSSCATLLVLIE